MTHNPQHLVYVYFIGTNERQSIGRLLFQNRQIYFEYDAAFLHSGLELSPFKLPLQKGVVHSNDRVFDGLFGIFNDSLPDGWGRLLLDRKLMSLGLNPHTLSPLDRLCFVGSKGMGALSYEPENPNSFNPLLDDLDIINNEIQNFQEQDDGRYLDTLLSLEGSSGGARPKILLKQNGEDWLIKFKSSLDSKDIGCIEYAYHLMAKTAGLNVPDATLFPSKQGPGFFGVKRFDRNQNGPIHMHTLSGLLHADHKMPSLDYETIMKATLFLTRDIRECEKLFRQAVFNVFSHNRDDHSKNFSYLMNEQGVWHIAPAYDLTFSSGPGGEHSTMVMGEGKRPKVSNLLNLAAVGEITNLKALEIIDQVHTAVEKWKIFAEESSVSTFQTKRIEKALLSIQKNQ